MKKILFTRRREDAERLVIANDSAFHVRDDDLGCAAISGANRSASLRLRVTPSSFGFSL
jgi:hypothetical protein